MSWLDLSYVLSGESRDPFHVPGKESELIFFLGVIVSLPLLVAAMLSMPWSSVNVAVFIAMGAAIALFSLRGLYDRRFRMRRLREVSKLRAELLGGADHTA